MNEIIMVLYHKGGGLSTSVSGGILKVENIK
jgi:hypothetical protein